MARRMGASGFRCIIVLAGFCLLLPGCIEQDLNVAGLWDRSGPLGTGEALQSEIQTRGGDAGPVIQVTTLQAEGVGSLGEALAAKGRRKVVFAVGGVIDLGAREWIVNVPFLTLDGASAPEPGVTLIRGGLVVATHDVIIRHLRIRPGEAGQGKRSGWEVDALTTVGGARDVVVEHCSLSWATDENLSASGPRGTPLVNVCAIHPLASCFGTI